MNISPINLGLSFSPGNCGIKNISKDGKLVNLGGAQLNFNSENNQEVELTTLIYIYGI